MTFGQNSETTFSLDRRCFYFIKNLSHFFFYYILFKIKIVIKIAFILLKIFHIFLYYILLKIKIVIKMAFILLKIFHIFFYYILFKIKIVIKISFILFLTMFNFQVIRYSLMIMRVDFVEWIFSFCDTGFLYTVDFYTNKRLVSILIDGSDRSESPFSWYSLQTHYFIPINR